MEYNVFVIVVYIVGGGTKWETSQRYSNRLVVTRNL